MARLIRIVLGAFGLLLYTWFGAVRKAPLAKRRKALRRARARAT